MIGVGLSLPQVAVRRVAAAASGPTVILDAAYLTDTLLNASANPVSDGDPVDSWAMATGGTFTNALAVTAGASAYPVYVTASGVHTGGGNAAVTCATPVTIPADTDCVIYVKFNFAGGDFYPLGHSTGLSKFQCDENGGFYLAAPGFVTIGRDIYPTAGVTLARARRTSNVWTFAMTGNAEAGADGGTMAGQALTFDTLLASSSMGEFSSTGNYIQKIKIWSGTSDPDTAYETANGGVL
jgi:hypothetical protein